MVECWDWTTNIDAAPRIFGFLGISPIRRERNNGTLPAFEGEIDGCLLAVVCPVEESKTIGVEQRDERGRARAGVILKGCRWLGYDEEDHKRRVVVQATGGYVEIMEGGLFVTIDS
ncbi:MAG: hypothetical protein HYT49_00050 [Candidatus Wildermuthbacteria bacterium]|nr:hypothetical protein [Candidatus Wildermuthbacteria bacterium]